MRAKKKIAKQIITERTNKQTKLNQIFILSKTGCENHSVELSNCIEIPEIIQSVMRNMVKIDVK